MAKISDYGIPTTARIMNIKPCPAPRMTKSDKWKTDPNHHDPRKRQRERVARYFAFKNEFNAICLRDKIILNDVLNICFILPMPESWSKKKKEQYNFTPHKSRPDRDNLLKAVQDASGLEDGHFWDGRTTKLWGFESMIIIY